MPITIKNPYGSKVRLKVKGNTISDFVFTDPSYYCIGSIFTLSDDRYEYASGGFKSATIAADGSFRSEIAGGAQVVRGTVRGKVAEGRITTYVSGCTKEWMFRARAR